ncbi:hypothetical protein [uncultured Ornithinimicrobium sp.]|uniref:hypothetical protein n=1 Tax=uncultured Ornithinimicrobium sp. TaxID=259307 RepID=UPI00259207AA|nr:hypothetical protein [uncultured Ornithinimicrobium sp.]
MPPDTQRREQPVGIDGLLAAGLVTAAAVLVLSTGWPSDDLLGPAFLAAWMSCSWAAVSRSASGLQELGGIGLLLLLTVAGTTTQQPWAAEAAWLSGLTTVVLALKHWARRSPAGSSA